MKKIIAALLGILTCSALTAQKNFEGEITYKLHASGEDKPDAELKILFGTNALKLRFKERENYEGNELLVLFDSAAQYTLNPDNRTYKKKALVLKQAVTFSPAKTIAGYSTTGVPQEGNSLGQLLGSFMMMGNSVFYVADTLFYHIPQKFGPNPVLSAIQQNKIVLGAEIMMQSGFYETGDTARYKTIITADAIEVKPMHFDDTVFVIPSGYTDSKYTETEIRMADSAAVAVDTAVIPKPVKKGVKKPSKPTGKKPVSQPAAIRRKQ